jgi:heat shock protein HslJ
VSGPGESRPGDALDGTAWDVARYVSGGMLVAIPAGVHADAVFAGGTVSGSAGCNRYTGGYAATGSALSFGPLATTMMACPPPASEVEAAYLAALATVASHAVTDGRLALLDASGAIVAELAAVPPDAYLGTWTARMVNDGRRAVTSPEAGSEITLELRDDGRASGDATCNRYAGTFTVGDETIAFGPLATTRMACPTPELAAQERAYIAALARAVTWQVRGDQLQLRDADGALQASFARKASGV